MADEQPQEPDPVFTGLLYGVGSVISIGIPVGIMLYNAVKDWIQRHATKPAPVPIVLRMFNETGNYDELIGIPHDMVVQFLESTYNVKIVTNKPKPRPPDKDLLKWLSHSMAPEGRAGTRELDLRIKEYMPYYKPKHQAQPNMSQLLSTLEEYRK